MQSAGEVDWNRGLESHCICGAQKDHLKVIRCSVAPIIFRFSGSPSFVLAAGPITRRYNVPGNIGPCPCGQIHFNSSVSRDDQFRIQEQSPSLENAKGLFPYGHQAFQEPEVFTSVAVNRASSS